jgi:hypothetical protein
VKVSANELVSAITESFETQLTSSTGDVLRHILEATTGLIRQHDAIMLQFRRLVHQTAMNVAQGLDDGEEEPVVHCSYYGCDRLPQREGRCSHHLPEDNT